MSASDATRSWDDPRRTAPLDRQVAQLTGRDGGDPRRRLVLLVDSQTEADELTGTWTGQAIDVRACDTLSAALLLIGRTSPDVVVIGAADGPIGVIDFLRTVRAEDSDTPVILGLDDTQRDLGVDALGAGVTAISVSTMAATTTTAPRRRSGHIPRSSTPSAAGWRSCWTVGSAAAAMSSRRWPSAHGR